jgi:hypothetical protein
MAKKRFWPPRKWVLVALAVAVLALPIAGWRAYHFMFDLPGASHQGALPAMTAEERAISARLKTHVATVAKERHIGKYDELEKAARYIERTLEGYGYKTVPQEYTVSGKKVRNIEVTIEPAKPDAETIVVGAHYDSAEDTPGANDNASGTASLLELARLLPDLKGKAGKRIRIVFFVNEEPPYFATADMGSARYARMLKERGERVRAMFSLETMGFYSDTPGSQKYPMPLNALFPNTADFVSFVGMLGSRELVHDAMRSFRAHTQFPTVGGVAPGFIKGIAWSDHRSFDREGFQALMITDTALFRYPHYHEPTDTPEKIDNDRLARVTKGVERVIRDQAK